MEVINVYVSEENLDRDADIRNEVCHRNVSVSKVAYTHFTLP
jgi:hypothetical protein